MTTENKTTPVPDRFWGQSPIEGEKFDPREFESIFLNVYLNETFLGLISLGIAKVPDPTCHTAYVGVTNNKLQMGYNPYFFRSLSNSEQAGVVIHELYHVVLMHLFERHIGKEAAVAWNIATDLAINSLIQVQLPDFALIPGRRPTSGPKKLQDFIANAPPLQCAEFYFEGLQSLFEEMKKNGDAEGEVGTLDDHSQWGNMSPESFDQIKDATKELIESAVKRADSTNNWGTVPQKMQEEIRGKLVSKVNWRSLIKMFFGNARSMERISTIKKFSKKLPGILPGVKRATTARFAAFIDQSGSMHDEDVALCFSEVAAASKETEIDVYNFDTEVDESSHALWKRGKHFAWKRTRFGGTDFQCIANFVNQRRGRWSGVIILTDGYAETMGAVNGSKILWIITPSGTVRASRLGDLIVQLENKS